MALLILFSDEIIKSLTSDRINVSQLPAERLSDDALNSGFNKVHRLA